MCAKKIPAAKKTGVHGFGSAGSNKVVKTLQKTKTKNKYKKTGGQVLGSESAHTTGRRTGRTLGGQTIGEKSAVAAKVEDERNYQRYVDAGLISASDRNKAYKFPDEESDEDGNNPEFDVEVDDYKLKDGVTESFDEDGTLVRNQEGVEYKESEKRKMNIVAEDEETVKIKSS